MRIWNLMEVKNYQHPKHYHTKKNRLNLISLFFFNVKIKELTLF
jgi:hypothetical protein